MSWLSDIVRATTGQTVGESVGGFVGQVVGGPAGAVVGRRVGGGITEGLDRVTNEAGQATARDIPTQLPAEFASSGQGGSVEVAINQGSMPMQQPREAFIGALGPVAGAVGRSISRNIPGFTGIGVGAAGTAAFDYVIDAFGQPKKLVITRKMKREVMQLYHMMNMDLVATARAYSNYKQMSFNAQQIQDILLKRFRNDGAYITKAAIRKTRSTVRKLERLEALKKQITGSRAAPRRRAATTTRITQVK
jgi:hypothetical protein